MSSGNHFLPVVKLASLYIYSSRHISRQIPQVLVGTSSAVLFITRLTVFKKKKHDNPLFCHKETMQERSVCIK